MRRCSVFGLILLTLVACSFDRWPASGTARYLGSVAWPKSAHGLGGFSGLEISADGLSFTTINDGAGQITHGKFTRDDGMIATISSDTPLRLRGPGLLYFTPGMGDSEGLAIGPDGLIYISFEGMHRVWAYPTTISSIAQPHAAAFDTFTGNGGLEALAIDAKGRLFAIPERSGQLTEPFPVFRLTHGEWEVPFSIPRDGGFLPTGADFDDQGRLYLLERSFSGFGFASRVRRFTLSETAILHEETLLESPLWKHDNLEGIAVWYDSSGAIRITMISDDNNKAIQKTEFVEYVLPVALAETVIDR